MTETTSAFVPFSFTPLDFNKVENYNRIPVHVEGFWSDVITIAIVRKSGIMEEPSAWSFHVSRSSGGYNQGDDDLQATLNFAHANIAAVQYCRELQKNQAGLEQAFQKYRAEVLKKYEEERKLMQEALAADPAVGDKEAKALINLMISQVEMGKSPVITANARASDYIWTIKPVFIKGKLKFDTGNYNVSKARAVEQLSSLSAKSLVYKGE